MHRKHVALIGVNSRIGPAILDALLSFSEPYQIYLLLRPNSKPPPTSSPHIKLLTLPDPATLSDLKGALSDNGIEYLVSALSPAQLPLQKLLADACVAAGVRRYVLADYGSCRSDDPYILDLLPSFRKKREAREHCIRLVEDQHLSGKGEGEGFSWTSIFTGHFFDYGLRSELLGLDIPQRKGMLFDGGRDRWSASTTFQIGRAVSAVLGHLDTTENKVLLIQSFRVSQQEVVRAVEDVLGEKLRVKNVDSREFVRERMEGAEKGEGEATEEMVAVLGIKRSDWKGDGAFANELLGLEEEDLDEVVKRTLIEDKQ